MNCSDCSIHCWSIKFTLFLLCHSARWSFNWTVFKIENICNNKWKIQFCAGTWTRGKIGLLIPCVIMVAQSLNFSCRFYFLLLIMTKFAHILSACDGQLYNLIARNDARILQWFLIVMFFSMLAILSHFLPSPFLAPGIAFCAVWENKNCSVQTNILQRLHADSESWNNLLWVLVDDMENKTGLVVVIHIYYVLNHAIKTEGWGEKCTF